MYSSKSHSMEEVSYSLTQLVSMEEVKNAMFAMNPYKGLGPDGFQTFLFQKYQMSLLKRFGSWWPMLMRQVISTQRETSPFPTLIVKSSFGVAFVNRRQSSVKKR